MTCRARERDRTDTALPAEDHSTEDRVIWDYTLQRQRHDQNP